MRKYISFFITAWISGSATALLSTSLSSESKLNEPATHLKEVLAVLNETESGKKLIENAKSIWNSEKQKNENIEDVLERKIIFGVVSKTDAVLTRHYNPETKSENRVRTVTVILKKNESKLDQVLDLSHELIHALAPPSWDPYDPTLSPGRYIYALLEKKGGEIEAVTSECQVAYEIEKKFQTKTKRCDRYFKSDSSDGSKEDSIVNRSQIQKDFYRIGKWGLTVKNKLKDEVKMFPFLSEMEPELYSATGRAPYPAALINEYEEITKIACQNVINRKIASEQNSVDSADKADSNTDSNDFLKTRCSRTWRSLN